MMRQPNDPKEVFRQFLRFKQGSHQAFQYFFDLHHQSLYLIIKGSVGDPEAAKDIVADAFKHLANNLWQINDQHHLRRYLYYVARNGAIDHYRKGQIRGRGLEAYARQGETVYFDPTESEMVHAETMEKIARAVEKLPRQRKLIFLLHYFFGEDTRSIANKLKIKEQTVRNQITRARDTLRKAFL
jgi:RNA polymerase sigma factor (sigma-70 family)